MDFKIKSEFKPQGDQPLAIERLTKAYIMDAKEQTLLGVTGSGKTFTVANIIEKLKMPTLILSHNKTLAGQLYGEFKEFFPDNAVEYFVSYYDYYQPEAYIAHSDTYIEKDSAVNDEIEKLRHSATAALFERNDVIIVASVSCIYGLGNPIDYKELALSLREGMEVSMDDVIKRLIGIQFNRNDINFERSTFRVKGDVIDVIPASSYEKAIRLEFFGDEIEHIYEIDVLTGKRLGQRNHVIFFPASHYAVSSEKMELAIKEIEKELEIQIAKFKSEEKFLEAQRIEQRTSYDIEMMREMGFCSGIENYSRILAFREPGSRPYTLLDYFPEKFLLVVDESHVTIPQVRGMYAGDISRKSNLVEYGFRLPSALDNRPLNFEEFQSMLDKVLYISATPAQYEVDRSSQVVEQVIRPTGLLDPVIEIKPVEGQIDDLYEQILKRVEKKERVLVTTLTKKMAEDLTDYLEDLDVKVKYMHSDISALKRMEIIRELRMGEFDVLIGINLLREGLDIPEVSLVAILDADKEGFLRSYTALIQTVGRAARNENGEVILYADKITQAMQQTIEETARRRMIQDAFNKEHGITPKTIKKEIRDLIEATKVAEEQSAYYYDEQETEDEDLARIKKMKKSELSEYLEELNDRMRAFAGEMDFENAAILRDRIAKIKALMKL